MTEGDARWTLLRRTVAPEEVSRGGRTGECVEERDRDRDTAGDRSVIGLKPIGSSDAFRTLRREGDGLVERCVEGYEGPAERCV